MSETTDPTGELLAEPLPDAPFRMLVAWLDEARAIPDLSTPDAMMVATVDEEGRPDARTVLCRGVDVEAGHLVFYGNRQSAKGRQLAANPVATGVFYWDALHRQVRVSGSVERSPNDESNAYFDSRPRASRIAAWASRQSQPLESRAQLLDAFHETARRFGGLEGEHLVPRPPHWGGYRLIASRVELWVGSEIRIHDRVVWEREGSGPGAERGPWNRTRLQP